MGAAWIPDNSQQTGHRVTGLGRHGAGMETNQTQPAAPVTLDPSDPRGHLATAVRLLGPVVEAVSSDQYALPTPCSEMTVDALLEHLVMVVRRIACAGRGEAPSTWPTGALGVAPGDSLDAIREAAHDVQRSWPTEVLDRPTAVPWGVFSGAEVLAIYTNELTVHTWDLATATGQQVVWDADALEASWTAIREQLPTADRTPMWDAIKANLPAGVPWEDPFGPATEVADDAPLIDRLVAWNGRTL